MPILLPYNRKKAVEYAQKWALGRNPNYFDFDPIGGDCTNYVSQVLYAGECVMNYKKTLGWYYLNTNNKSPSWTGVNYLYNFLTSTQNRGPTAEVISIDNIEIGDILQLNFGDDYIFDHSLVVTKIFQPINFDNILVCSHTFNRLNEPLSSISFQKIRFLHITGSIA